MKRWFLGLFLISILFGQNNPQIPDITLPGKITFSDTISGMNFPNTQPIGNVNSKYSFNIGETLHFDIKYGFIKAGTAIMMVRDTISLDGRTVIWIQTMASSVKTFDPFFKVRDTVSTFIDFENFVSRKFVKKLREGGYLYDLIAHYKPEEGKVYVRTIRYRDDLGTVRKMEEFELEIPDTIYDVLASFYKIRNFPLDPDHNKVAYITNHDNKKIYDLKVEVLGREVVDTPYGKFRCLKIEPRLKGEAIFKQSGRLWIWITEDEYKIPVKMSSKVAVGSITTVLTDIKNGPLVIPSRLK